MYNTVWSEEYSCYVSKSFAPSPPSNIKLDITKCSILITKFNYYELWLKGKKIKELNFNSFMKFKNYVKEIIEEVNEYE